jgi:uncharacterized protein (TIGR02001 family)
MQKKLVTTAVIAALSTLSLPSLVQAADAAPASPHTLTANVGATSNYVFRGISQTAGKPALSAGIDYSHSSGIYLGTWLSQITWVKDAYTAGSTEIDFYGGYKNTFAGGDWNYDIGMIRYTYPGSGKTIPLVYADPATTEVYGAIGYKWLSLKYSQVTSSHFVGLVGNPDTTKDTKGSTYIELNASYDMGNGWGVTGHYGSQKIANNNTTAAINTASYNDWKLGVTKDAGFGVFGLAYSATDAKGSCNRTALPATNASAYCWGTAGGVSGVSGPNRDFNDVAKGTLILDFKKTF